MLKTNTVVALSLLLMSQFSFALQEIAPLPARLKSKSLSVSQISRGATDSEINIREISGKDLGTIHCPSDADGFAYLLDTKGVTYTFLDSKKCWKTRGLLEKYSGDKDVTVKILLDLEEDKVSRVEVIDAKDLSRVEKGPAQVTK